MTNQDYGIDFERIKELISKYEEIKRSGEIRRYNEESTKKNFILPLFDALGWNVYSRIEKNYSMKTKNPLLMKEDENLRGFG
jgi:hypothetical protein